MVHDDWIIFLGYPPQGRRTLHAHHRGQGLRHLTHLPSLKKKNSFSISLVGDIKSY